MKNYSRPRHLGVSLAVALAGVAMAGAASGHHAVSAFDPEQERTVAGTVMEFEWMNPHTQIRIEPAGLPGSRLGFEGMSADFLGRRGWHRRTLQPGDLVEIAYFPFRDGAPGGLLVRVRLAGGTVLVMIDND